jgi:hypothetical protein
MADTGLCTTASTIAIPRIPTVAAGLIRPRTGQVNPTLIIGHQTLPLHARGTTDLNSIAPATDRHPKG